VLIYWQKFIFLVAV